MAWRLLPGEIVYDFWWQPLCRGCVGIGKVTLGQKWGQGLGMERNSPPIFLLLGKPHPPPPPHPHAVTCLPGIEPAHGGHRGTIQKKYHIVFWALAPPGPTSWRQIHPPGLEWVRTKFTSYSDKRSPLFSPMSIPDS